MVLALTESWEFLPDAGELAVLYLAMGNDKMCVFPAYQHTLKKDLESYWDLSEKKSVMQAMGTVCDSDEWETVV